MPWSPGRSPGIGVLKFKHAVSLLDTRERWHEARTVAVPNSPSGWSRLAPSGPKRTPAGCADFTDQSDHCLGGIHRFYRREWSNAMCARVRSRGAAPARSASISNMARSAGASGHVLRGSFRVDLGLGYPWRRLGDREIEGELP